MTELRIAKVLSWLCLIMGSYLILDARVLQRAKAYSQLSGIYATAARIETLPGGEGVLSKSGESGKEDFLTMMRKIVLDRDHNERVGIILFLAGAISMVKISRAHAIPPHSPP